MRPAAQWRRACDSAGAAAVWHGPGAGRLQARNIQDAERGADGKPRSWFVNPVIHEIFAAHADAERQRRAEVVETLRDLKAAHKSDV